MALLFERSNILPQKWKISICYPIITVKKFAKDNEIDGKVSIFQNGKKKTFHNKVMVYKIAVFQAASVKQ